MLNKKSTLLKYFWIICLLGIMAVWSIRLVGFFETSQLTELTGSQYLASDQVAQQSIVWSWQNGFRQGALTGDDNFLIKFPLYLFINNLPLSPLKQVFLTSLILLALTAASILWSINKIIGSWKLRAFHKEKILLALSLFLAATPTTTLFVFAFPNSRNIEIGLVAILLSQLYLWLRSDNYLKKFKTVKILSIVIISACLAMNDPLYVYAVVAPVILLCAAHYFIFRNDNVAIKVASLASLSTALGLAGRELATWLLPLDYVQHTSDLADIDNLVTNGRVLVNKGLSVFGIDILGEPVFSFPVILGLLFGLVFAASIVGLYIGSRSRVYEGTRFFNHLLILLLIWSPMLVMSTDFLDGQDTLPGRYLIYTFPIVLFGLMYFISALKYKREIFLSFAVLIALPFLLLIQVSKIISVTNVNGANDIDRQIVATIQKEGLTKGYAYYQQSVVREFISGHRINIISVECSRKEKALYQFKILNETSVITKPANRTFYTYIPDHMTDCTPKDLEGTLGRPTKIVEVAPNEFMAIYDYDIGTKVKK